MFEQRIHRSKRSSALAMLDVIYVSTVREVRKGHGAGGLGLITNILQTLVIIAVFYFLMNLMGARRMAIRGDFLLYVMSGVFMFMLHIKTIKAVYSTAGPTSAMMLHAPMNTIVALASTMLSTLYLQVLSILVILFVYHAVVTPVTIDQPVGAMAMLLMAWFSGAAIGLVFLVMKPWMPATSNTAMTVFIRLNMFASGKMFVANALPGFMLPFFDWNPLFHVIDQMRGFVFLNYSPHFTSILYPVYVALALVMLGLMGEFFTRRHASASWDSRF